MENDINNGKMSSFVKKITGQVRIGFAALRVVVDKYSKKH